jgi:hypothetical protein
LFSLFFTFLFNNFILLKRNKKVIQNQRSGMDNVIEEGKSYQLKQMKKELIILQQKIYYE